MRVCESRSELDNKLAILYIDDMSKQGDERAKRAREVYLQRQFSPAGDQARADRALDAYRDRQTQNNQHLQDQQDQLRLQAQIDMDTARANRRANLQIQAPRLAEATLHALERLERKGFPGSDLYTIKRLEQLPPEKGWFSVQKPAQYQWKHVVVPGWKVFSITYSYTYETQGADELGIFPHLNTGIGEAAVVVLADGTFLADDIVDALRLKASGSSSVTGASGVSLHGSAIAAGISAIPESSDELASRLVTASQFNDGGEYIARIVAGLNTL